MYPLRAIWHFKEFLKNILISVWKWLISHTRTSDCTKIYCIICNKNGIQTTPQVLTMLKPFKWYLKKQTWISLILLICSLSVKELILKLKKFFQLHAHFYIIVAECKKYEFFCLHLRTKLYWVTVLKSYFTHA